MKNVIKLSLILAISLISINAAQGFTNPLGSAFKSTDNGGTLPAIDAYKDGVGVVVLDNLSAGIQVDNSAMNTLVYKYGYSAKIDNKTLFDQVTLIGTTTDKLLIPVASPGALLSSITSLDTIPPGSKATFTFNGGVNTWNTSHSLLFDGLVRAVDPYAGHIGYIGYLDQTTHNVNITVDSKFRVWTYQNLSSWLVHNAPLVFKDNNTGLIVNNSHNGFRSLTSFEWTLASDIMPAGNYTITAALNGNTDLRLDSEWFIEKVE